MNRISFVLLIIFLLLSLYACGKKDDDIITVDEDNCLIVNGVRTEFFVKNPEERINLGVSKDGYWIIDNEETNYPKDIPLEISIEDGLLVIFDYKLNIKVEEEEIVGENYNNVGPLFPN